VIESRINTHLSVVWVLLKSSREKEFETLANGVMQEAIVDLLKHKIINLSSLELRESN